MEFAALVLIAKSQVLVPSVAPKSPAPLLIDWPAASGGGAGAADQLFDAVLYAAASTPVPAPFLRYARIAVVVSGTSVQSFWSMVAVAAKTSPSPPNWLPTTTPV